MWYNFSNSVSKDQGIAVYLCIVEFYDFINNIVSDLVAFNS